MTFVNHSTNFVNHSFNFVGHLSNSVGHLSNSVGRSMNFVSYSLNFVAHSSNFVNHSSNFVNHSSNFVGHSSNSVGHSINFVSHSLNLLTIHQTLLAIHWTWASCVVAKCHAVSAMTVGWTVCEQVLLLLFFATSILFVERRKALSTSRTRLKVRLCKNPLGIGYLYGYPQSITGWLELETLTEHLKATTDVL